MIAGGQNSIQAASPTLAACAPIKDAAQKAKCEAEIKGIIDRYTPPPAPPPPPAAPAAPPAAAPTYDAKSVYESMEKSSAGPLLNILCRWSKTDDRRADALCKANRMTGVYQIFAQKRSVEAAAQAILANETIHFTGLVNAMGTPMNPQPTNFREFETYLQREFGGVVSAPPAPPAPGAPASPGAPAPAPVPAAAPAALETIPWPKGSWYVSPKMRTSFTGQVGPSSGESLNIGSLELQDPHDWFDWWVALEFGKSLMEGTIDIGGLLSFARGRSGIPGDFENVDVANPFSVELSARHAFYHIGNLRVTLDGSVGGIFTLEDVKRGGGLPPDILALPMLYAGLGTEYLFSKNVSVGVKCGALASWWPEDTTIDSDLPDGNRSAPVMLRYQNGTAPVFLCEAGVRIYFWGSQGVNNDEVPE